MKSVRLLILHLLLAAFPGLVLAQSSPAADERSRNEQIIKSLNWVKGPQTVKLFDSASFAVPAGYVFLDPADTKKLMEVMQNPSNEHEYLFGPEGLPWFGIFEYEASGYVKDDEKIDAEALLESIRNGTEASNKERRAKGWGTMTIAGWKVPPNYSTETKRLEWAIDGRTEKNESVINFNTRILGRRGVTSAVLVAGPDILDSSLHDFKDALRGYEYAAGEGYSEFRAGDKVAEYGLAALVAGGAAAVAVKTGFWKVIVGFLAAFWKLIAGVVIAAFAGLRSIFKRKSS
jgi:uncharacterized membrane-anchored protein